MFTVRFHSKVRADFRKLDTKHIAVIRKVIEEKIAVQPDKAGKPLRRTLKNIRSTRVGQYRILYEIRDQQLIILVLIVGKRDTVYDEVKKRLED